MRWFSINRWPAAIALCFGVLWTASSVAPLSADPTGTADLATKETKSPKPSVRRLPPYYAQVGLSADQRSRIKKIQDEFAPQIDKLEAELASLRSRQSAAIADVLTAEQTARLARLKDEVKGKGKPSATPIPPAKATESKK